MFIHILIILLLSSGADSCDVKKNNLNITTPSPMEALNGTCLFIPCTFKPINTDKDINTAKPVTGIWCKTVIYCTNKFSISGDPSKSSPMNFTGNLKNKECTTMFYDLNQSHQDDYYFRVENVPFTATDQCNPLQIRVLDSPWSPSLQVSGAQTESEVVTITCTAVTPCPRDPPVLTWDLHQGTANINETNSDGTFTTKITHTITLTDSDDGRIIKCSAAYPVTGGVKTTENTITLNVTYGPKDTSAVVSPSGSLSVGQSVTLSCSSRAKPPVHHFTWFRNSSQGAENVSQGQTYSFNFTEEGEYYCVASNALRTESSQVIRLRTKGDVVMGPYNIVKLCGIALLYSSLLLIECLFRAIQKKQGQTPEPPEYENDVTGTQT